jgi:hypothetical protein
MEEFIPKSRLFLGFNNPIKIKTIGKNIIQIAKHDNFYVVEDLFTYFQTQNLNKANKIFEKWC